MPAGAAPAACASDGACGARERCVCGRCTVAACASDADCAPGEACPAGVGRCVARCDDAARCPAGSACAGGRCVGSCRGDGDCARGERCAAGRCEAVACADDAACGAGARCDAQRLAVDAREPAVVAAPGGGAWLYAEVDRRAIWRAVSADGVRFRVDPPAPVLAPGPEDGGRLGAPAALRTPAGVVLVAARGDDRALVLARAPDGASFGPPREVLSPAEPWEGGRVGAPAIAPWRGALALAYEAAGGIGLATLAGDAATRVAPGAPALAAASVSDPARWPAVDRLAAPALAATRTAAGRDVLRVYFAARGAEPGATAPRVHWSLGLAGAEPARALHASPYNPLLVREDATGFREALEPSPVVLDGRWSIYLRGESRPGEDEGLLVARE